MAGSDVETLDAVVLGGSMRGMVTAYVLSALGHRAVLIERAPVLGGGDGSFRLDDGTVFDYGMHVLDFMRSRAATRLLTHAVGGRVHKVRLRRGIALRGRVMPYSPDPSEMPAELRAMLPPGELVDDLGDAAPTRERLAACYGQPFADLVFDEVLPSFPSESRHLAFGVDASRLLTNIYPWFFPRARRCEVTADESRSFHDRLRAGVEQYVLYPRDGGFAGFVEGLRSRLDPERVEVLAGAGDVRLDVAPGTHTVERVVAQGREFRAEHYFWCSSWPELCRSLDLPCQDTATDRVVIGSFRLDRPAVTDFHEVLVGDPEHAINRVHFPARFRESDEPLMQVEFAFPRAEDRALEPEHWREAWMGSLRRLGLLEHDHRVERFDFKTRCLHFNAYGCEGEPLRDADPALLRPDSNVRPVVPSMANLNLNRHVPRSIRYVADVLADVPPLP